MGEYDFEEERAPFGDYDFRDELPTEDMIINWNEANDYINEWTDEDEFLGALAESEADVPYPYQFGHAYWDRIGD